MRSLLVVGLAAVGLGGCGGVEIREDPVAVRTKVTRNGRPVQDVLCCFTPHTADQLGGEFPLDATGNVTPGRTGDPKLIPGRYSVHFQPVEGKPNKARYAAAFKAIPARHADPSRPAIEVEVRSGGGEIAIPVE
jgi:hypothetical protein